MPTLVMLRAGLTPDPWQAEVLASTARQRMLLCARQVGKTQVAAAEALRTALLEQPATVLVISPSERQSGEFVRAVKKLHDALQHSVRVAAPVPVRSVRDQILVAAAGNDWYDRLPAAERESALQLHLENGSRIVGLPAKEANVRGYPAVNLLVIDEASRVPDDLYRAIRPTVATSQGRILALSTPFGKRGWFYEAWGQAQGGWRTWRIAAHLCPRIPRAFLEEEQRSLGARWYRQEYECSFEDAIDQLIPQEDIDAAFRTDLEPLFR